MAKLLLLNLLLFLNSFLNFGYSQSKPTAVIISPVSNYKYKGGELITFSGTGTDLTDGDLPASSFTWMIKMNHGTGDRQHWHDGIGYYENIKTGEFRMSEADEHVLNDGTFFRIFLVVKNSKGITDTSQVDIFPQLRNITINSVPPGLTISLGANGPRTTPFTGEFVENMIFNGSVALSQSKDNSTYTFSKWNDNSTRRSIGFTIPAKDTTITAYYTITNSTFNSKSSATTKAFFPNPFRDILRVDLIEESFTSLTLYDNQGSKIEEFTKPEIINGNLDLSFLVKGIYFLSIDGDNGSQVQKIVKE